MGLSSVTNCYGRLTTIPAILKQAGKSLQTRTRETDK